MTASLSAPVVTRLTPADLPQCARFTASRGWTDEAPKWAMLLDVGGVYAAHDTSGTLLGTAAYTPYRHRSAAGDEVESRFVAMTLVAPDAERRGIATTLVKAILDSNPDGTAFLESTAAGQAVYERLGFVDQGATHVMMGPLAAIADCVGSTDGSVVDISAAEIAALLDEVVAYDAARTGMSRPHVVHGMLRMCHQLKVSRDSSGALTGVIGVWRAGRVSFFGPLVADSWPVAQALLTAAVRDEHARFGGDDLPPTLAQPSYTTTPTFMDDALTVTGDANPAAASTQRMARLEILPGHDDLHRWATQHGWADVFAPRHMTLGEVPIATPTHYYTAFSVVFG